MAPSEAKSVGNLNDPFQSDHGLGNLIKVHRKPAFDQYFILTLFIGYWIASALLLLNFMRGGGHTTTVVGIFVLVFVGGGAWWGWRISTWWNKAIGIYEGGMVYVDRRGSRVIRWDEVSWIRVLNLVTVTNVGYSRYRKCVVAPLEGEPFLVTTGLTKDTTLFDDLQRFTFPYMWERAVAIYEAGAWVDFGPIRINKALGLEMSGDQFEWENIAAVKVVNGSLRLTPNRGKLFGEKEVLASRIKNVSVLLELLRKPESATSAQKQS
jgi:hypothetical protein